MTKEINASFRMSFKQPTRERGDVFYTFEYGETRTVEGNIEEERKLLWDTITEEVSIQVQQIINQYKK